MTKSEPTIEVSPEAKAILTGIIDQIALEYNNGSVYVQLDKWGIEIDRLMDKREIEGQKKGVAMFMKDMKGYDFIFQLSDLVANEDGLVDFRDYINDCLDNSNDYVNCELEQQLKRLESKQ